MFDLVLKGGRVVDPSTKLDGIHDIAVQDGKIARVAAAIPDTEATRVIEVGGKIACCRRGRSAAGAAER